MAKDKSKAKGKGKAAADESDADNEGEGSGSGAAAKKAKGKGKEKEKVKAEGEGEKGEGSGEAKPKSHKKKEKKEPTEEEKREAEVRPLPLSRSPRLDLFRALTLFLLSSTSLAGEGPHQGREGGRQGAQAPEEGRGGRQEARAQGREGPRQSREGACSAREGGGGEAQDPGASCARASLGAVLLLGKVVLMGLSTPRAGQEEADQHVQQLLRQADVVAGARSCWSRCVATAHRRSDLASADSLTSSFSLAADSPKAGKPPKSKESDFDRVFHPFTVREKVTVAPVNAFLKDDSDKVDVAIDSMPSLTLKGASRLLPCATLLRADDD